jgi:outer membrane protein insertion porin family
MRVRVSACVSFVGLIVAGSAFASPQDRNAGVESLHADAVPEPAIIDRIQFVGLHGLAEEAAKSRVSLRAGEQFDPERLAADLHALNQSGWFEDVFVEAEKSTRDRKIDGSDDPHVELIFHVKQYPFLIDVQYSGSAVLSEQRIKKLLGDQKLAPQIGMPANPVKLHLAAAAIESELAELGHPDARVTVAEEKLPHQKVKLEFQVHDGPRLPIRYVHFSGDPGVSDSALRKQMREIAPDEWFSGLRNKNVFTQQKGAADRLSLLTYLKNHGFPEAHVGVPEVTVIDGTYSRSLPWFHRRLQSGLSLDMPIDAGERYKFGPMEVSASLQEELGREKRHDPLVANVTPGQPFSQHALDSLQRAWEFKLHRTAQRHRGDGNYRLQATPTFDSSTHLVSTKFDFDPKPVYTVRHIDFRGNERFPDRYLRRRIGIREGQSLDEYALEAGLARLTRTGYFQPIKKQDIQICTHEADHTVDVIVHLHEKGRQRTTFSGGREQFGSTLGIAYTVFNLLGIDEFISTQFDGGPETLQLAIGMAKEGFLGSRGTLALSLFDTFVRPRLTGGVQGPFQRTQSDGVNLGWSYAVSDFDSIGFNYRLSHSLTDYAVGQSAGTASSSSSPIQITNLQSETSSHSFGIGWTHNTPEQKFQLTDSVSGGWLGGSENLLRSNAEYAHIFPDEIISSHNAWAFRTTVGAAGSYKGDMPLYALFFPSDNLVRGLQPGELGPYETVATVSSSGTTTYSAVPAGANIVAASNLEYRFPLGHGVEGDSFFDVGSGLLLPNWMGSSRPSIIESTNGLLHASTGVEVSWKVPTVGVPLRINYAFNVLRLNRPFLMPDSSLFRVHDRIGALGWGLGPLF